MKSTFTLFLSGIAALLATPALAGKQSVTLSVPGMSCAVCPITVKKALNNVKGVNTVAVDFDGKKAAVTFDDTKTNTEELTRATANAGYPSTVTR
jgi:mercuric ion binding protein